jgi:hypothetical protein
MNLDLTITPVNPPITIPANGGSFHYLVNIHNLTTTMQPFQFWNKVKTPSGTYVQVFGPIARQLPGNANPTRNLAQNISASIPAGLNTFISYIGTYPVTIQDSSFFTFTKLTAVDGGPWIYDNNVSGDFFEEYAVAAPAQCTLKGNYPNPFNPTTTISFSLVNAGAVKLAVFDISGREVATLVNGYREAGAHNVTFDASNLTSGVYVYRLSSGDLTVSGKMILMK